MFAAQALADVATIAILQHRVGLEAHVVNEQLNEALNSRIVIEQAKGVIAERAGIDTDEAFARLRNYARSNNLRLADVAARRRQRNAGSRRLRRSRGTTHTGRNITTSNADAANTARIAIGGASRRYDFFLQLNSARSPRQLLC